MISSFLLLSSLLGATLAAPSLPILEDRQAPCAPVHIMTARGSHQSPNAEASSPLIQLIQQGNPGSDVEDINYPADLSNTDIGVYFQSEANGTLAIARQLSDYVNRCPSSKLVLFGYSQVNAITP